MARDRFVVFANQYNSEADALADYDSVHKLYTELGIIGTFDAAVLTRKADGKVEIVKRVSAQTHHRAALGLFGGMALGAALSLFPALTLAGGLVAGGVLGGGVGAIAGHMVTGMSRSDMRELGEVLDSGTSGLVIVAAPDVEERVEAVATRARKRAKVELQADTDAMKKELDAL